MSDYEVGRGKPPKHTRFKPGNQAARGRKAKAEKALALPEILHRALNARRKIKRGDRIYDMAVGEIMIERLIQMMTTGDVRDIAKCLELIERYAPERLASVPEPIEVVYRQADGSTLRPAPRELWGGTK